MRAWLTALAAASPDSCAVLTPDGEDRPFRQLEHLVAELAARIPAGGGRVAVRLDNDVASLVAIHAVWRVGASMVAVSRHLPDAEARRRMTEVGARALVVPADTGALVEPLGQPTGPAPTEEAVVMFTSGTTGRPKAASVTFAALEASLRGIAAGSGLPPEGRSHRSPARDPQCTFVPLAHMGGLLSSLSSWWLGKPLLLCPKFSVPLLADLARRYSLGVLRGTPAMLYELAHWPEPVELPGVTSATAGTAALPEATRLAFQERFGIPILRNYGSTEFAGAIAFERPGDATSDARLADGVGRLAPGVEVRIVDRQDEEVPAGEVGEIVARSASAMSGYLDPRGRPAPESAAGWIHTGDLGILEESGQLRLVGRLKDVVICGGFNVYPAQVEALLNRVEGVADSAVVGLPDERLGELPVAVVVPLPGAAIDPAGIKEQLRQELPPYEVPRHVVVAERIPRHDTGKVDRLRVLALVTAAVGAG